MLSGGGYFQPILFKRSFLSCEIEVGLSPSAVVGTQTHCGALAGNPHGGKVPPGSTEEVAIFDCEIPLATHLLSCPGGCLWPQ